MDLPRIRGFPWRGASFSAGFRAFLALAHSLLPPPINEKHL